MFVSHFNSYLRGGAATAARQLHTALLDCGVESRFHHLAGQNPNGRDPGGLSESYSTRWATGGLLQRSFRAVRFRLHRERFKRATRGLGSNSEIFTSPRGKPFTPWPPLDHPAASLDSAQQHIIHLHWISKFIDIPSFFASLPEEQPVVWTLHDMNALTGGCHFSGGCQRFRQGCGNCPQVTRPGPTDASFRGFETKRAALSNINLHVVAPSCWLLGLARSSPLLASARSFNLIPYGMPTESLYPIDQRSAREALGIPIDTFLICFGAMNLESSRKGGAALQAALKRVGNRSNVHCLVFGSGRLQAGTDPIPHLIEIGSVDDEHTRRLVYSAADVFVLPSTEDNLPLTGLEAMACGTPVIGFDAGGIPDYVIPGETGMLAENGNSDQLADALLAAITMPTKIQTMGTRARQLILDRFQAKRQAQVYLELYRNLLGSEALTKRRAA